MELGVKTHLLTEGRGQYRPLADVRETTYVSSKASVMYKVVLRPEGVVTIASRPQKAFPTSSHVDELPPKLAFIVLREGAKPGTASL